MDTRLGRTLYNAGLAGAALSLIYVIDVVWLHTSGKSLVPIPGRFASREEMLAIIAIGTGVALLFWGCGAAARHFMNKSASANSESK